jgi:gliding motility-associated-like protein
MKRILPFVLLMLLFSAGMVQAQLGNINADESESATAEDAPVFIPNAFTPNGDGVNDYFYIPDANLIRFTFSVSDRWGNQVYYTNLSSFRWDGQSKGRPIPSGVYVFVLDATTAKNVRVRRSGTITVVR